jgi:hypothetical protein
MGTKSNCNKPTLRCPVCGAAAKLTEGARRWFVVCQACGLTKMGRSKLDVLTRLESCEPRPAVSEPSAFFDLTNLGVLTNKRQ